MWTGWNKSGQLRIKNELSFCFIIRLYFGIFLILGGFPTGKMWTGLNHSGQFRIKRPSTFLLFHNFYNSDHVIRYSGPTHGLVDCIPVRSGLFRFYPVLFCSKLFRNEFGSVRFWSFLNWFPVLSIGSMSDNIRWFLMFTLSEIIFKFKTIKTRDGQTFGSV